MIRFLILSGILLARSFIAFSYPTAEVNVVHICCYSNDPSSYPPNCYDCEKMVYKFALTACLNATEMPNNISYKAANCMEKNCQVEPPKPVETEQMKLPQIIDALSRLLALRSKRSVEDNNVYGTVKRHVVKEVKTLITGSIPIEFGEPEYM